MGQSSVRLVNAPVTGLDECQDRLLLRIARAHRTINRGGDGRAKTGPERCDPALNVPARNQIAELTLVNAARLNWSYIWYAKTSAGYCP